APSRELLDQAFVELRMLWRDFASAPDLELNRCHVLGMVPRASKAAVYFSTPQMLVSRAARRYRDVPPFDLIVFDEAHHAGAPTFGRVFEELRSHRDSRAAALGLSATPGRRDEPETESLTRLFNRRLVTSQLLRPNALETLQKRGILSHLEFLRIKL